mmetsp:Transcript_31836/g.95296  ORF Transcript_31836/g.95296 Transcript_31836/m.95296 type:complete len:94 (+) Transcript_31836:330-611(+)
MERDTRYDTVTTGSMVLRHVRAKCGEVLTPTSTPTERKLLDGGWIGCDPPKKLENTKNHDFSLHHIMMENEFQEMVLRPHPLHDDVKLSLAGF